LTTDEEKTKYFLDKVIEPGLGINCTKQFEEMLRVIATSDGYVINYLVGEMQKFISTSSVPFLMPQPMPLVNEEQSTSKGKGNVVKTVIVQYE